MEKRKKFYFILFFSFFKKGNKIKIFRAGRVSGARCDKQAKNEREREQVLSMYL